MMELANGVRASLGSGHPGALLLRAGLVYDHALVTAAGLAAHVTGLALWNAVHPSTRRWLAGGPVTFSPDVPEQPASSLSS
jgi:hypothetical protein